jgi:hypothetical protein
VRTSWQGDEYRHYTMYHDLAYLESCKSVGADFERSFVYPIEEFPENTTSTCTCIIVNVFHSKWDLIVRFIVENDDCNIFVPEYLSKHRSARNGTLSMCIASTQLHHDFGSGLNNIR